MNKTKLAQLNTGGMKNNRRVKKARLIFNKGRFVNNPVALPDLEIIHPVT